jgi:DNA polymerase IV
MLLRGPVTIGCYRTPHTGSAGSRTIGCTMRRVVLHLDMDAFFAAVEQHDHPELRGKPVLIGSDRPRGVVATASYEARVFGCGSAQPMSVAKRRCPHAIVVPPRGRRYAEVSEQVFAILLDEVPLVEPLSIDEAFMDLTGTERLLGDPIGVARRLRERIRAETGLTASVGVAPNKFLAKLASDLEKPDGLTVIRPGNINRVLDPLPIERLWGVGPATARRFHALGLRTIGDVRRSDPERLHGVLGHHAEHFLRLARGEDDRPVTPDGAAKSIGHECTFEVDVEDPGEVHRVLRRHIDGVGRRLRRHGHRAGVVTVKIRYGAFETITRSATLKSPTDGTDELWAEADRLFTRWVRRSFQPVRLIGVSAGKLTQGAGQLDLFAPPDDGRSRRLDETMDRIRDRFGGSSIRRGPRR